MNIISRLIEKTEWEIARLQMSIAIFDEAGVYWRHLYRKSRRRTVRRLNRKEKLLSILKALNK